MSAGGASALMEGDDDIVLQIMGMLPCNALLALGQSNRRMHELAGRCSVWAPMCARRWALPTWWASMASTWPTPGLDEGGPSFRMDPAPDVSAAIESGRFVVIRELRMQPERNGQLALAIAFDEKQARWVVAPTVTLTAPPRPSTPVDAALGAQLEGALLKLQPDNLTPFAPLTRPCWKCEWGRRTFIDRLMSAELQRAHAETYPPGSEPRAMLTLKRQWLMDSHPSLLAARSLGESAWESLRAAVPDAFAKRCVAEAIMLEAALQDEKWRGTPVPIAVAYLREINRDVRLQDWCRLEALLEAEHDVPIEAGALVIAAWDDPLCNVGAVMSTINALGAQLAHRCEKRERGSWGPKGGARVAPQQMDDSEDDGGAPALPREQLEAANELIFNKARLQPSNDFYYDMRNSLLHYVVSGGWRQGIPITLAIVYAAVCRRAGLSLEPVSMPLHFVLGIPQAAAARAGVERLFVDVFAHGRVLTVDDARATLLNERVGGIVWRDEFAEPCGVREVWVRMLRNINHVQGLHPHACGTNPYAELHKWTTLSAQQRHMHIEADLVLRNRIRETHKALCSLTARGAAQPTTAPGGIAVTDVLGLWPASSAPRTSGSNFLSLTSL